MEIAIFTSSPNSRRVVKGGFDCLEAAERYALQEFNILHYDRDQDTDNCADFITKTGDIYVIEPV
jgi:hypothetical protein